MERVEDYNYNNMVVLCREVDKKSGRITVSEMPMLQEDGMLSLKLRSICNVQKRYFITTRPRWEGPWHDDYMTILKRKNVSQAALRLIGGLIEV